MTMHIAVEADRQGQAVQLTEAEVTYVAVDLAEGQRLRRAHPRRRLAHPPTTIRVMATISEALAIAIQHHQAGRLQAAEQIYRQILAVEPNHADALHLLGVIASPSGQARGGRRVHSAGDRVEGERGRLPLQPGQCVAGPGKPDEAVACYRRALELKPDYAEAHNNLGVALKDQGKLDEAVACYRRALELKPDYAEAHNNLGTALKDQGKLDEAVACYRRALELKPDYAEAHNNLGTALQGPGEAGRGGRLLPPGTGTEAGLCRGTQQPGQCA